MESVEIISGSSLKIKNETDSEISRYGQANKSFRSDSYKQEKMVRYNVDLFFNFIPFFFHFIKDNTIRYADVTLLMRETEKKTVRSPRKGSKKK